MHHSELNRVIGLTRPALHNVTSSDCVKCFKWKQWHYNIFSFQLYTDQYTGTTTEPRAVQHDEMIPAKRKGYGANMKNKKTHPCKKS